MRAAALLAMLLGLLAAGHAAADSGACAPDSGPPVLPADADAHARASALLEHAGGLRRRGALDAASAALDAAAPEVERCAAPGPGALLVLERGLVARARGDHASAARILERVEGPQAALAAVLALGSRVRSGPRAVDPARIAATRAGIEALASPRERAHARLRLAQALEQLASSGEEGQARVLLRAAAADLEQARIDAVAGGATALEARALAALSGLYARDAQPDAALRLARRSLFLARAADDPGAERAAQARLGSLARARSDRPAAIAALRAAVELLSVARPATADDAQRALELQHELVDLLLQSAARAGDPQATLREARDVLEALKADELRDYFADPCVAPRRQVAADAIAGAVVVYPVALPDRLELIVGRGGRLLRRSVPVGAARLEAEVHRLRRLLEKRTTREYVRPARQLHDWLVRPLGDVLAGGPVEALVFVPGGALRTVPLAALIDRETGAYLVEQYPLAVTPGIGLTEPRALPASGARVLAAGVSRAVGDFAPLPHVEPELAELARLWGARVLANDAFVISAFERAIRGARVDVVHVASHAEFRGARDGSFLLAWDGRLSIDRLAELIDATRHRDDPIELLALSACETAAGDERAALGLAGVAVRAGARSALATLWPVNDQVASELVGRFYAELARGASRARALQRAQIAILTRQSYRHPAYWAPFLLISSWL